jgi:hypothetical protein
MVRENRLNKKISGKEIGLLLLHKKIRHLLICIIVCDDAFLSVVFHKIQQDKVTPTKKVMNQ